MIAWIYILTNKPKGTLYIGVTSDIERRIAEHRQGLISGFSKKHNLHKLVYMEEYPTIEEAIAREKQLKHWNRPWKIELIEKINPAWQDILTA